MRFKGFLIDDANTFVRLAVDSVCIPYLTQEDGTQGEVAVVVLKE